MTRSRLFDPASRYVGATRLDDFTAADWALLAAQRPPYQAALQADQVLRLLSASKDDPSFGYHVNNYRHCVQAATLALRDGRGDDYVTAALLHDIGFISCPTTHGEFAAKLLAPYVDEKIAWIVERHAAFLNHHDNEHPTIDRNARERWRGHPYFDAAAEFVARYDQNTVDAGAPEADLATFEPILRRVFTRAPRPLPPPA
ncbi:MAG: peptidase [Tagaea sp.]|nr:peptidase [Tagaea sp.]